MTAPTVIHSTFVIERSYPKPPQQVFAAFADPAVKRRWFAESEHHDLQQFELDFRPGGSERTRYLFLNGPIAGATLTNEETYQDIVPNQRIVTSSVMTLNGKPMSASQVTIEFVESGKGTDLICTHQGAFFEGADGPQMREAGWRKLLDRLAANV